MGSSQSAWRLIHCNSFVSAETSHSCLATSRLIRDCDVRAQAGPGTAARGGLARLGQIGIGAGAWCGGGRRHLPRPQTGAGSLRHERGSGPSGASSPMRTAPSGSIARRCTAGAAAWSPESGTVWRKAEPAPFRPRAPRSAGQGWRRSEPGGEDPLPALGAQDDVRPSPIRARNAAQGFPNPTNGQHVRNQPWTAVFPCSGTPQPEI